MVAAALRFIRLGLAVNLLQLLVWLVLVVLPFIVKPPASFSWSLFRSTKAQYLLQGYGLGSTFLFYGEAKTLTSLGLLPAFYDLVPLHGFLWVQIQTTLKCLISS